ncbi:hypothetical protein N7478_010904 [Penicillium angulare]|uniref:uncharacterized protein n=1 Tax=Penicillium angulare TaxID=116970 RepID=UPI00253F7FB6|nr:uncharacterized protein N7478_010904 [Penicillium angulare]KAJ5263299.1 hypothetical protein N7478_010904 [Penicillium angulare]
MYCDLSAAKVRPVTSRLVWRCRPWKPNEQEDGDPQLHQPAGMRDQSVRLALQLVTIASRSVGLLGRDRNAGRPGDQSNEWTTLTR